ncbi:MAG: universal stress protein, partial [Bacteroidetes bacterium]|nr:universal stress protein [Bacteroidota bacterium]
MEGYLHLRINPWLRRLLTRLLAIIPAILVIIIAGEEKVDNLIVLSQVILSVQLGFAIIPLIHFVSDKKTMGKYSITYITRITAWIVAALLVYLNIKLVYDQSTDYFVENGNFFWKAIIIIAGLAALALLIYIVLHPWISKRKQKISLQIHPQPEAITNIEIPQFKRIAIALDFSKHAEKLIAYAIGQGNKNAEYILIHVVESASARMLGKESDDFETRKDQERLDFYKTELQQKGYNFKTRLGYQNRSKEIVRIIREENIDMLVIGAHGHTGLKDFIYGETVNTVRHELKIPVLIVNL